MQGQICTAQKEEKDFEEIPERAQTLAREEGIFVTVVEWGDGNHSEQRKERQSSVKHERHGCCGLTVA